MNNPLLSLSLYVLHLLDFGSFIIPSVAGAVISEFIERYTFGLFFYLQKHKQQSCLSTRGRSIASISKLKI